MADAISATTNDARPRYQSKRTSAFQNNWCNGALELKKSPSWCLRGRQQQGYKQTRVSDAAGNRHSRRLAAHDGATKPFGIAVQLLPDRSAGASKPRVKRHRPLRQVQLCT